MSLIADGQNLFVVDLHYVVSLDEVEPHLDDHVAYLEDCYANGHFVFSGPKEPRTGGVIIAAAASRAALDSVLKLDPFMAHGVAKYTVTEFRPSMMAAALQS